MRRAAGLLVDKASRLAYAKALFSEADLDGSGAIDASEATALVRKLASQMQLLPPEDTRVQQLLALCDSNHDGLLQADEFLSFFKAFLESAVKHSATAQPAAREPTKRALSSALATARPPRTPTTPPATPPPPTATPPPLSPMSRSTPMSDLTSAYFSAASISPWDAHHGASGDEADTTAPRAAAVATRTLPPASAPSTAPRVAGLPPPLPPAAMIKAAVVLRATGKKPPPSPKPKGDAAKPPKSEWS